MCRRLLESPSRRVACGSAPQGEAVGSCSTKSAKQNRVQTLGNTQSRETGSFRTPMISMAYDQRRETFRFAWRNTPFAFAVLRLVEARNATGGLVEPGSRGSVLRDARLRRRSSGRGRWEYTKLRKGGVKRLKSLARVTLCARARRGGAGPSPSSASSCACDPSATGRRSRSQSRR